MAAWQRLIRFEDDSGNVRFGDAIVSDGADVQGLVQKGTLEAKGFQGSSPFHLSPTGTTYKVKKLLGVLSPEDVPIIKCIGLNYMKHIQEGGRKPPPYPSVFIKPRGSVASFNEDIPIPKICQTDQLDYEGELVVIIKKTGKDIPKDKALDYVAGFVAGNDVSARTWQRDPAFAGGVPQWCFSKGFDKFASFSPTIVSPEVVGNAGNLRLQTRVNGELRQDTSTDDLLFNVERIIEFISQGTTLEEGTAIMTGTPAGVAMGMSSPKWLQDGDIVEVSIEQLGSVKNKMSFL
ncbi:hypothetical protein IQ07DRAFT_556292 [Pyrenochaeta sp. DS3sAY3a]|nr:hypothetical protein IQ07DRAFT_556292 [Pyrenochaeta sp. DS3sAY3a]